MVCDYVIYPLKAVLASTPDMECGFSRELFIKWCTNPHNSIIFTSKTGQATLSRILIDNLKVCGYFLCVHLNKLKSIDLHEVLISLLQPFSSIQVTSVDMNVSRRVPLQGAELEEYRAKEKEKMAAETAK